MGASARLKHGRPEVGWPFRSSSSLPTISRRPLVYHRAEHLVDEIMGGHGAGDDDVGRDDRQLVKQYESLDASPPWSRIWCTRSPRKSLPCGKNPVSAVRPPAGTSASSLAI